MTNSPQWAPRKCACGKFLKATQTVCDACAEVIGHEQQLRKELKKAQEQVRLYQIAFWIIVGITALRWVLAR